ncbi:hypothetical protein SBA4_6410003 [Candidatus Sulfopaludibacter sp. SbA4]|nr:hypothetical protein SBA4_6410003 [Candidatus Sulfopaludibacter sp. SbA4]
MSVDLRHRMHRRGELFHTTLEGAFLSATSLILTLLTLIVLCVGVLVFRAG